MKNCGNCKHWDAYVFSKQFNIRQCNAAKMFWDATEWSEEKDEEGLLDRRLNESSKDCMAFVQDGSDYRAYLLTREAFYCSMHESK